MPKIALCLSGGGLRATFFHFGVIKFLRTAKILDARILDQVTHISSVSGGSILAAHLVANWEKYIGSDSEFAEVEGDLLRLARWDIRGNVIRRWLLAFPLGLLFRQLRLTKFLQWEYTKFYRGLALRDLENVAGRTRPALHLLTTSFTTGQLCSFSSEGLWLWSPDKEVTRPLQASILPLSLAVAASSAFPPLFPPVRITSQMLGTRYSQLPQEPEYLTDGGVYDNLGSQLVSRLKREGSVDADLLFISDAGATFDWEIRRRFWWVYPRTVRSTNILMKRVTDATLRAMDTSGFKTVVFPISEIVPEEGLAGSLPPDLQQRMSDIRTDLDSFAGIEGYLIRHGYEVAHNRLVAQSELSVDLSGPSTASTNTSEVWDGKRIQAASVLLQKAQRLKTGLVNFGDWSLYALIIKVLLIAGVVLYLPLRIQEQAVLRKVNTPVLAGAAETRVITITNATTSEAPENQNASATSFDRVRLSFLNGASEPITLYWIDFTGNEIAYGRIEPGESLGVDTFVGHLWVAKTGNNKVLMRYLVER
jgi:predicted acylesterase/phospholipase RssA